MEREIIDISPDNIDKLNELHGNERYAIRYTCESCKTLIEHGVKDGSYIVTRNFYPGKLDSYKNLKCESCAKSGKKDPYFDKPGCDKNWPLEVERNPAIFKTFQSQNRNRVWIKFNCSNCNKEVITEYDVWSYTKDPAIMNRFKCRECNCSDTKQPYYDSLAERDKQYESSFEHTEDGYKIIHNVEEMKRLATNAEKIAFHCEEPTCEYHTKWFKMDLAKKDRVDTYIKFGKLLCENCRFKRNYDSNHANKVRELTFQENWGVAHPMKNEEFKKDYYERLENKYGLGVKSTLVVPETQSKTNETNLKKFGTIHPSQNPEVAKKMSESYLNKTPEEKERILNNRIDTNRRKFNKDWYVETDNFIEAEKQGNIEKFGVENPLKDPEIGKELRRLGIAKIEEKYGTKCYFGSKAFTEKLIQETGSTSRTRKYFYYGQSFDSSWELALWIFAIDHGLPIYRCPIVYEYEYAGTRFTCNPDFLYINQIVEIKGNHFINKDGKMYLPFRKPEWSDTKYEFMCNVYEAKRQCLLDHGVVLWFKEDIKFALNYVTSKYGINYLRLFLINNEFNPSFSLTNNITFRKSIYSYPIIHGKGVSPYDMKVDEGGYVVSPNKGVSPYDIGLLRIKPDQ